MESERSLAVSAPSDEMLNLEKFAPLLDGRCSGLLSTSSTTSKCKNAIFYRSRDCDYTSIEGPSEVNDKDIDETNYDYCFSSPKEEGTCQDFLDSTPVQTVDSEDDDNISEFLYDSWYEELDDMLKDYVDVGGSHYEESDILSCLEGLTEKSAENSEISCFHDAKANQMCGEKLYSSSTFDTDEDRNRIYDQWLLDLVTWERNRLMWLDDVSEIEGFDSLAYADRTFLIQVSDESAKTKGFSSSPENGTPRTESNDCDKLLKIEEYRNPHYRKQCQQHHECLCNLSYTNKYHNVLQDLGAAEILSTSLGDIKEGNWKENSCNETCSNGPCVLKRQNLLKEKLHVPHDVVLVYQFTDRNFWKKK